MWLPSPPISNPLASACSGFNNSCCFSVFTSSSLLLGLHSVFKISQSGWSLTLHHQTNTPLMHLSSKLLIATSPSFHPPPYCFVQNQHVFDNYSSSQTQWEALQLQRLHLSNGQTDTLNPVSVSALVNMQKLSYSSLHETVATRTTYCREAAGGNFGFSFIVIQESRP